VYEVAEKKSLPQTCIEYALWDCLGPLRHTDINNTARVQRMKLIGK